LDERELELLALLARLFDAPTSQELLDDEGGEHGATFCTPYAARANVPRDKFAGVLRAGLGCGKSVPRPVPRGDGLMNSSLAACLLAGVALSGCGDDSASDGQGGGPNCGTASNPDLLQLRDVIPTPGSTVPNVDVIHSFTIVDTPGLFETFTFISAGEHTAGQPEPSPLQITIIAEGPDLRYTAAPVTYPTAPGHVEFSVAEVYQTADGCYVAFPDPLFSFDVEPGGGGAGGAGGGGGAGGVGGSSSGGSPGTGGVGGGGVGGSAVGGSAVGGSAVGGSAGGGGAPG
jgi:hypothetical protein